MSFVNAVPGALGATATNLASIGTTIKQANAIAAHPTSAVVASAPDQVSTAVAAFFNGHAEGYQAIGAQAEAFHQDFVRVLACGAGAYATAENDNATAFGDSTATPRSSVGHPDQQVATGRAAAPGAALDPSTTASSASVGGAIDTKRSIGAIPGVISIGGVGSAPVPEAGRGGASARISGMGAGSANRAPVDSRTLSTATAARVEGEPAQPAGQPAPARRRGTALVILNARGAGSGGVACRGRHIAIGGIDGGSGGIGTRAAR